MVRLLAFTEDRFPPHTNVVQRKSTGDRVALIVRDSRGRTRLFELDGRRGEYSVRTAADFQAALAIARTHHPDVVLMDDSTPDTSGPLTVVPPDSPKQPPPPASIKGARNVFQARDLKVDFEIAAVTRRGRKVELSPTEFELLKYFIENRGRIISRAELLEQICGYSSQTRSRTIDTHVYNLRRKLNDTGVNRLIQTVHQMGFTFKI